MLFTTDPLSSLSSYWSAALAVPAGIQDENDSISSTFTAFTEEELKSIQEEQQQQEHQQDEPESTSYSSAEPQEFEEEPEPCVPVTTKHVTFNEDVTEYYDDPRGYMTGADLEDFWLSAGDYYWLKQTFRHAVKQFAWRDNMLQVEPELYERHQEYLQVLHEVYDSCCQEAELTPSYRVGTMCNYDNCNKEKQLEDLAQQLSSYLPNVLHGCERTSSRILVDDKAFRRSEVLETVLNLQNEFDQPNDLFVAEMIRCASENVTRPACLMAQRLAEAHARVVAEQQS